MVDGWSREGIPRGSFGPVREVGFLDLPQEVFYCLVTHMTCKHLVYLILLFQYQVFTPVVPSCCFNLFIQHFVFQSAAWI